MTTTLPRRKLIRGHHCIFCNRYLERGTLAIVATTWQGRFTNYYCNETCWEGELDQSLNATDPDDDEPDEDDETSPQAR